MFHPLSPYSSSHTSEYAALGGWMSSLIDVAFSIYMEILQGALLHHYLVIFTQLFLSRLKNVVFMKEHILL